MTGDAGRAAGAPLEQTIERLRRDGRVGLMTHIVLGYPSIDESRRLVGCMVAAGVDLIEVQIPFSDPTADGPVITRACQAALEGGVRVADAFAFVEEMSRRHPVPFLFMSYVNLLYGYHGAGRSDGAGSGTRDFVADAAKAGVCGLIVPDMPPEAGHEGYAEACRGSGVHPVFVISPNVSDARLELMRKTGSGLIYATSRTGTTGRDMDLELDNLRSFLARAREITRLPVAVGFSISKRDQIEALEGHADVAVVGTHLIRVYEDAGVEGVQRELGRLVSRESPTGG